MSFKDLRHFIDFLEQRGQLVRVRQPVSANQEITIIQHRVMAANGPALLFENVEGSPYRLVTNLFGTRQRVDWVYGGPPAALGQRILGVAEQLMPLHPKGLWHARRDILKLSNARLRRVKTGPILETCTEPADLERLPVLFCWPEDGGPFFTLPLVHTVGPADGRGNLGIYRLQRYDAGSTGMHWQIEKGGGFHFKQAAQLGQPLAISVILGGPPALTIAAVAPLPEGIDERLLAALMSEAPLEVIHRPHSGHRIPARAEFVLEGTVTDGDLRREGPFGDHFGHYSHSADFPVFRVQRVLARRDAIYPATVVGKPVQEDFYIGEALQEMSTPLLKLIRPAVTNIWAYPETGFHPLAVMAVKQRYPREALKHTLGMLGEGQVSLTKIMITVDSGVDVKNFDQVGRSIWQHLDFRDGLHLISPTAQDTLDFTGPAMNSGSRLVLVACHKSGGPLRQAPPPEPPPAAEIHPQIDGLRAFSTAFLLVRLTTNAADLDRIREALKTHPVTCKYLFQVLLSPDIDLSDSTMVFWGWFTRFDPLLDLYPADRQIDNNRLVLLPPIAIDARWKSGYPKPVEFDPAIERRVDANWSQYDIPL